MTRSTSAEFTCASLAEALHELRRPLAPTRGYVTMSPMKEKPMSTKRADPPRGDRASEDGKRKKAEPRPDTRRRVRKIVERHRETFDELAK